MNILFKMIKKFKGLIKKKFSQDGFFTNTLSDYKEFEIGDFTYGRPEILFKQSHLKIGKYCSIADGVTIFLGGNHRIDWVTTYPFNSFCKEAEEFTGHPSSKGDVIIGNDVWIGHKACIMSGCKIGDGAVIAAKSVITKDIPPYSIAAGNPAKIVKYRFTEDEIDSLLKIAWWNFPDNKVKELFSLLMDSNIEKFINIANTLK